MLDTLIGVPTPTDDKDMIECLHQALEIAIGEAERHADRLLDEIGDELGEEAAEASSRVHELLAPAREARELDLVDEDVLTTLVGMLTKANEYADWVLAADDLRRALGDDHEAWSGRMAQALAIAQMSVAGFVDYALVQVGDMHRVASVERRVDVPIVHALMRAIVAGMEDRDQLPLDDEQLEANFDELLIKVLERLGGSGQPGHPLEQARRAQLAGTALWNLARHGRKQLDSRARAVSESRRRTRLSELRLQLRPQRDALGALPDLDHWYDVGIAFAHVEPMLTELAERKGLQLCRGAEPALWLEVLRPDHDEAA